jgi:hypothetical protein
MGQGLSYGTISRCTDGAVDLSCDLSTGSGRDFGRFVSAPVPLPFPSPANDSVISLAPGDDMPVSHQPTFFRVPPVRQVPGALF